MMNPKLEAGAIAHQLLAAPWARIRSRTGQRLEHVAQAVRQRCRRTRVHHVYYLLAAFDLVAVAAGLLLTHHAVDRLAGTVRSNLEWASIHQDVARLRWVVGRVNAPGNDVFESKDAASATLQVEAEILNYQSALDKVRYGIASRIPEGEWTNVLPVLQVIDTSMHEMVAATRSLLQHFAEGNVAAAGAAMAVMDRQYGKVLTALEMTGHMLRTIEMADGQLRLEGTRDFRRLELAIVAMLVLMVLFVTIYGKRVSRLVEQQHAELERFNAELEARVAERTEELAASEAVTRRQKLELELRNQHLDIALNNMNRGLCLFDSEQRIVVVNNRYLEMYDLPKDDYRPGTALQAVLEGRVAQGHFSGGSPEAYVADRIAAARRGGAGVSVASLPDGRVIEVGHFPTADGGFVTTHDDITDRRRMEQQIVHLAHHDALTGLPNRRKLLEELEAAIKRTDRDEMFAVLCMDLDHFKQVNDTLGHPIGDRLLQVVADRLRQTVRKSDIVARLGGDEFAIIQVISEQPDGSVALACRIIQEISLPFEVDGHQIVIGTSVGIAIAPADGSDANTLLKNADLALYRAKSEGKGAFRLFEPEMDARAKVRRQLELDLRRAVALGEFDLHFQPLVEVGSGEVTGFEALLRWRNKDRGIVPPADFIPMAEEIGLMGEIGSWVLKRACMEAVSWPSHCRVAVNISPAQFRTRQLDVDVMTALSVSGLAPERLELEITETVLLERTETTMAVLHRLRECGIRIAMDDFGTGYSSLSYLHTFPFDKIKIDRSFTQSAGTSSNSMAIVQAVLELGRNLGMSTTAEGVETAEQLLRLRQQGCVEVQGYLFSKPVPASEIPQLLARLEKGAQQAA